MQGSLREKMPACRSEQLFPETDSAGHAMRRAGRFRVSTCPRCIRFGVLGLAALLLSALAPAAFGQDKQVPQSREEITFSFAAVVKRTAPAVANIFSKRVTKAQRSVSPLFDDPLFKRFFGDSFGQQPKERTQSSLGSGVVVSPQGLVVTNHHVIEGATEITVVLADRREFEATLVLSDERTDLAVLKIDPSGDSLPWLELRDSDEAEVGDLVLALGNPFGVGQTVTSGIISALARTRVGITDFGFFIQTDAAINPGNSGGALVTMDGKLIGINTAIFSGSGGSVGIGFAIPSNMVRTVIEAAGTGHLVRAWTGFAGQTLTADLAEGMRLDRPGGVIVNEVYPGGPAERAGIHAGDIVLAVDGRTVADWEGLRYRVATEELGDEVSFTLFRDGETVTTALPLEAPTETPPRNEITLQGPHPLAGCVIASLSPALSEEVSLPGAWEGVIVLRIARRSPAGQLGFRPGDIIYSVNGDTYKTSDAMAERLETGDQPRSWQIKFIRNGKLRTVSFH